MFRTGSPEAVKEYILNLARERGVKSVVKSKSMASEEIHLNPYLEKAGIAVKETDLGEWIIQLAGQTPSHMVLPAIHMTKEEVAELFSKEVNERLSSDIPRLVKVAREQMREKFLAADMGISGANIAVAETGSIVLVTNEGNARLVTTLPKIHVAIVGLEKLVEKFDDIGPILTALPKSATAQLLTSYVSIITGPTPVTDGTQKELHIILMDNRRTEMSNDPKFKQALQCIRCGSCLNVCPVFRLVGGHVFGKVYTGGIGTILTAWFDELKKSEEIQGLCIQCGNCKQVCPGKNRHSRTHSRDSPPHSAAGRPAADREGHVRRREQPQALPLHPAHGIGCSGAVRQGWVHSAPADVFVEANRFSQPARNCRRSL